MKPCRACGVTKELDDFFVDNKAPDKRWSKCKSCAKATNKVWRERNKAHLKAYVYQWRELNKDAYHAINAKSRSKNHARVMVDNGKRRTVEKRATPSWARPDAMRAIYREAKFQSVSTGLPHHVDHIVPLKSEFVCGLHVEHNMQVLPALENCFKNNRTWPDMPERVNP